MWLLHLLPDSFILGLVCAAIGTGLVGILLSFYFPILPIINQYRFPVQIISIALFCTGIYWYGGYATEMIWRARVAEMEEKVRQAEIRAEEINKDIEKQLSQKTQVIRERGKTRIEYINRLVEGKTVEIVKDMSAEERAEFEKKQRELQDALKNCPVPRIIVEEHNKAAASK